MIQLNSAMSQPSVFLTKLWRLITPELPMMFFGYSWTPVLDPVACIALVGVAIWTLGRWPMAMLWVAATLALQLIIDVPRLATWSSSLRSSPWRGGRRPPG